jgi:hypothetical protein
MASKKGNKGNHDLPIRRPGQRTHHARTKQNTIQSLAADIGKLVRRLQPVLKKAEALGIFLGDRELLECLNCGLKEDVLISGQLITYRGDAVEPDSGLRFIEVGDGRFRCPFCRFEVELAPENDEAHEES